MRPEQTDGVQLIAGEPLRFMVASESGEPPYLVDLGEYNGNGQCACKHFEMRMQPDLERGAAPDEKLECKHIKKAVRAFRFRMIEAINQARGENLK